MCDDPDLVVTSVDPSLRQISKHELRRKLLNFLAVSLPPVPLSFVTFEAHVKAQCETYYDNVMKEVYESLTNQWNRRLGPVDNNIDVSSNTGLPTENDPITISSDEESESEEHEPEKLEPEERECDDSVPLPQPNSREQRTLRAFTDEELIALKAEKSTKKYTRYLQETYDLIKSIEGTTSCNICCKLKRRIQKFVSLVGQESAIIQQKVAKELRAHRISPEGSLTEAALEKMRMGILIDKLIDITMPDIVERVEMMEPKNDDGSALHEERETKEKTVTAKKKEKKKSKRHKASADVPQNNARPCSETVKHGPLLGKNSTEKKKEKKKPNVEETSTGAPRAKARKISVKITDSSHPGLQ